MALLNVLAVLEHHPGWRGVLGFDELLNDVVLLQRPPYLPDTGPWARRPLIEQDYREMAVWLQRQYKLYASSALAGEGLTTYGFRFPFHVIRDYLCGLAWDATPRLDTWLSTYCGAADTPYVQAVGSKTLIAAVARIFEPGCKVDTMTILEGEQGTGKSTVWNTLASDAWFADWLPDLHDKDAAQTLCGKWFIELGELASIQRSEVETIKRFLSAKQDHYRPSYGKRAQTFPRQNIFVGSTNEEHYLKDATGNRRFWPVAIGQACDLTSLQRDRHQLWAEAVVRYRQRERWYLTGEIEAVARDEQDKRIEPDDWTERVLAYAATSWNPSSDGTLGYVQTYDILVHELKIENPLYHTQANTKRLGSILRRDGWKSVPIRKEPKGKQFKAFTKLAVQLKDPPVTGNSDENRPTGNSEACSNDASCTCVTCVTGRVHMMESVSRENLKGATGTTGNRVPPVAPDNGSVPCADAPVTGFSAPVKTGNSPEQPVTGTHISPPRKFPSHVSPTEDTNNHPPKYCPGCSIVPAWLIRETYWECHKCHTKAPRGS